MIVCIVECAGRGRVGVGTCRANMVGGIKVEG